MFLQAELHKGALWIAISTDCKKTNTLGHWNRPKKTKQEKTKPVQSIPKTVWLLERPNDNVGITDNGCYSDYATSLMLSIAHNLRVTVPNL